MKKAKRVLNVSISTAFRRWGSVRDGLKVKLEVFEVIYELVGFNTVNWACPRSCPMLFSMFLIHLLAWP